MSLSDTPASFPEWPGLLDARGFDQFWWPLPASRARVLDAVENLLDAAHPHFIHPFLVRNPASRKAVRVRFTSSHQGGEARYDEAEAKLAWLPRLFEGRRLGVVARYLAPTLAQLSFEGPAGPTFVLTVVFTPESESLTRPFAHFATPRGLLPAWLKRWALIAFHTPVLRQDLALLAQQADAIERFGGPHFHHGPLDVFGPLIWRLANGHAAEPQEREFELLL